MRKKILFYLLASVLLVSSFALFTNAYRELVHYAGLTNRGNIVYAGFQDLSKEISNAAVTNPVLHKTESSKGIKLFFADSGSVIRKLNLLRSLVRDPVNIEIADKLDVEINKELSWLLRSDVPDSIVDNSAPGHISALQHIQGLIEQGIIRTGILQEERREKLNAAFYKVIAWMLFFIGVSVILIVYTVFSLFREQSKTKAKEQELEVKEKQFRHTLDNMLEGVQMHDFNWRYIYINNALESYSTYSKKELLGFTLMEKYPGIEQTDLFKALQRCMTDRVTEKIETDFVFPNGTKAHYELSIQPIPEGIFILSVDKTEQKRAKDTLVKVSRLYAFISAINQTIVHTGEEKDLFDQACTIAVEIGEFTMAWIDLLDEKSGKLNMVTSRGVVAATEAGQKYSGMDLNSPLLKDTPAGRVISSGRYAVSNDVQNDPSMGPWKEELMQKGIKASISLPIKKYGKIIGMFGFHSSTENFFDEKEITLLEEAAGDISFALEIFDKAKKQKETEELVIKNEKRFRALIEKSTDMVTLSTPDGQMLYGSPSITRQFGYTPEEIPHRMAFDFIHPNDLPAFAEKRNKLLGAPGASFYNEQRLRHKNGSWIWCETVITNLLEEPGVNALVANFRDISDKKRAEEEREFNKNNQSALINNTGDLMWSVDREFKLITSNDPFKEIIRKATGTTIEKGDDLLAQAYSAEQAARFKKAYEQAFTGESFTEIEYNDTGTEYWMEISYSPIRNGNEVLGAACHSRDITAVKKAELQLRKSESFNRGVLSSLSSHIAVVDADGTIVAVNESWKRFAIENGDASLKRTGIGTNYFEVCAAAVKNGLVEAADVLQGMKDVFDGKRDVYYLEYPCYSPQKQRWFGMRVMKFHSDEPMIVVAHQDITEQTLAEQKRHQSELRLKEAQALAHLGNWELNFETGTLLWSEEACRIYGLSPDENKQTYASWLSFVHPEDLDQVIAANLEAEKTLSDSVLNHRIILKDGTVKYIYSLSKIEFDAGGKPVGLYGISHDITELRLAEQEREEMVTDLVQRSKNLEQFAYIISHNLRGPVANMLGIANALKGDISGGDRDKMQSFLFIAVEQLDNIIKDLVKILQTRSEITENKEKVDLRELVDVIRSGIQNLIEKEDVKIIADFAEVKKISTLKSYCHSIFYNLISNSIKYRQPDKAPVIKIKSSLHRGKIRLVFEDNGTGIDLDQHGEKIFGLYKRFHPNIEGKGVGLFMVKTQIEVLGGTIRVESGTDEGTKFIIELPV